MEILKQLNLPPDAEQWLNDMWDTIQMFDDIEDGDKVEDGNKVLWNVMVNMPLNSFFQANQMVLMPVIITQILKWEAANEYEKVGEADEKSYMWRAGFYDLVLMVCYICFGRNIETCDILALYGETYAEYKKEFQDA